MFRTTGPKRRRVQRAMRLVPEMKRRVLTSVLTAIVLFSSVEAWADTAQVLPRGVSAVRVTYYHYFDITERYDPKGNVEDIDTDFNTNLNSNVFPALAPLDPLVGGSASIGSSVVDFTLIYRWWEFAYSYGITDKLSLGIQVPYNRSRLEVDATLDTSTANVGKNPAFPAAGPPVIPIAAGGVPLTDEDVQALLGPGLDVDQNGTTDIAGFGYERFDSFDESGVGDIELLVKYKFFDKGKWRLATGGGVRLPTGEPDDPDDLTDLPFGDGQSDILLRFFADYRLGKKWLLNGTFRYDWQLPDKETKRVPDDVNQPVTANREHVDRDLGDILELEFLAQYAFTPQWLGAVKYRFTNKAKDDVDGDLGFAYSSLEKETDLEGQMVFLTLAYSTIQKYRAKQFRVPLVGSISYRNRFDGKNNATKSEYVSLELNVFF